MPASSATLRERVGRLELLLVPGLRRGRSASGMRLGAVAGEVGSAPLRHRPDSQPPASGLHGMTAHAVALAGREHVGLDAADEDRVRRLLAHEALAVAALGDPLRLDDRRRRERRAAEVAHLALVHEVATARRASRRCRRSGRAGAPGRGRCGRCPSRRRLVLALAHDPAPRAAAHVAGRRPCRAWNLVASTMSSRRPAIALADDLLGLAGRVHVGGVDEVDAGVERGVDDRRSSRRGRGCPTAPNIIAPRHRGLTCTPVRPNARYLIVASSVIGSLASHPVLAFDVTGQPGPGGRSRPRGGGGGRGYPILSLAGAGAGALGERVGHRVLAEQEVAGSRRAAAPPAGWSPRS